jgi:hypothetical protein
MKTIDIEQAEKLADRRLDRRRKYATTDDGRPDETTGAILFSIGTWTQRCSGCSCEAESPCSRCLDRGHGCQECGYTGKRRVEMWVPVLPDDDDDRESIAAGDYRYYDLPNAHDQPRP